MIKFGGPVFLENDKKIGGASESHGVTIFDPETLARAHTLKGFKAAYAPNLNVNETDKIRQTRKAFEDEGVVIAEVGYWENLIDTNKETRKDTHQKMLEALYLAEELGARCAVNIIGSYIEGKQAFSHKAKNFTDDAFAEAVDMARYFIDTVKPKTAYFTYEVYQFSNCDSPDGLERFLKAVDRPQFGVHLDLVNFVNSPRTYFNHLDLLKETIRRVGDRIVCSHIKDVQLQDNSITVLLNEVLPGTGIIDLGAYVKAVNELPQIVPMMMEHLNNEEEYNTAASNIRKAAAAEGVSI